MFREFDETAGKINLAARDDEQQFMSSPNDNSHDENDDFDASSAEYTGKPKSASKQTQKRQSDHDTQPSIETQNKPTVRKNVVKTKTADLDRKFNELYGFNAEEIKIRVTRQKQNKSKCISKKRNDNPDDSDGTLQEALGLVKEYFTNSPLFKLRTTTIIWTKHFVKRFCHILK